MNDPRLRIIAPAVRGGWFHFSWCEVARKINALLQLRQACVANVEQMCQGLDVTVPCDVSLEQLRELLNDDQAVIIFEGRPHITPDASMWIT